MTGEIASCTRLALDGAALIHNWQLLDGMSGPAVATGAAVKADAYGLGAVEVVRRLQAAGCKDFFVANWREAQAVEPLLTDGTSLAVLNGIRPADMDHARQARARPVLNSPEQLALWRPTGRPCDIMLDSGMSRLGFSPAAALAADWSGLTVETLHSHLASGDEDVTQNADQLRIFREIAPQVPARRRALANSAGIALGGEYHFDLTRPGIALYGGIVRSELSNLRQVVAPQAEILQIRDVSPGARIGYNGTFVAERDMRVAIVGMGYADGYFRGFSGCGEFDAGGRSVPVVGRVSMDLIAIDITTIPDAAPGDWLTARFDLPWASSISGMSQYELLTGLGDRFDRVWR